MTGLTLDQVRPHMHDFESKHYTNPTLMFAALKSIGVRHSTTYLRQEKVVRDFEWPRFGLCRVQWEGPWTNSGVPIRARYRHTHWIGVCRTHDTDNIAIFDINCINNGSGWTPLEAWRSILVPYILKECVPRASGKWHITHAIEIGR